MTLADLTPNFDPNFVYLITGVVVALITNMTLIILALINHRDIKHTKKQLDTTNGATLGITAHDIKVTLDEHIKSDERNFQELRERRWWRAVRKG